MSENKLTASGALAWSQSAEMSKEEIDEFLSGRWLARLATNGKGGYPHIAPMWYYWDGESLYFTLTRKRRSNINLVRDKRCSVVIDMDERPLMGMRTNLAKAVFIEGDAVLIADQEEVGRDVLDVWYGAGPFKREMTLAEALIILTNRYGLWERDGALGLTHSDVHGIASDTEVKESDFYKHHEYRTFIRIEPTKVQAWDFAKTPIGYVGDKES